MRILTLVPPEAAAHLTCAVAPGTTILPVRDVAELARGVQAGVVDALVIDPRLVPPRSMEHLVQTLRRAGTPLLAHTALTSLGMRALLALSPAGVRGVLIRNVDDDPSSVRRAVDGLRQEALGGRVLAGLDTALQMMPELLRAAISTRFISPDAGDTPHQLAAHAGMNRRSLDRWVARSGIISARLLVAAPKLVLAYDQLGHGDASVADVAALAGYSSPRSLERQCHILLGLRPSALRRALPPDGFAGALARGLLGTRPPALPRRARRPARASSAAS